ncbi:hypothetical protein COV16_03490 [Candidatus Woesearchaeota archaeon CG10_big_fil_rev_8_21_14_0_10_34_8]|nr:MAG: hypothetical protein COV16_03490 [Candidatus Woesearchaeota archaeon CG10_big_fil_rev_8_21_14_0_10_34_8]
MKPKLDLKDRRILYQLDTNSRQSNSQIAKKVGLSKQVVGFRIKRLLKQNMLSFYAVIDISKLGFTIHKNFLRLQNINRNKEKQLLNFLKNHPNIVWIASCDGKYDLAFGTWAKDMEFLDKTIKELDQNFGKHISERHIATIIKGQYFIRDYLIPKTKHSFKESFFGAVPTPTKIDETNWKILVELGKDARKNAVDIAKEINVSADAVGDRIKKLEKAGVIKHYNIVPNESNYPYLHYKVLIGLRNITEEKENKLIEFCHVHPNIVYIVKALGPWEFEIDIECSDTTEFREIMMDIKTQFSDIVKDYSALQMYQVHKYNFCPSMQI